MRVLGQGKTGGNRRIFSTMIWCRKRGNLKGGSTSISRVQKLGGGQYPPIARQIGPRHLDFGENMRAKNHRESLSLVVIGTVLLLLPCLARAQDAGERIRLIELGPAAPGQGGSALLYRDGAHTVQLLRREGLLLKESASGAAPGRLAAAAWWSGGSQIAAAFEPFGPEPLRCVLLDQALREVKLLFEAQSSRPDVLRMLPLENKLLLNYFDSKYFTRAGFLAQGKDGQWGFQELFRTRMGMYVDRLKDGAIVVGRPYRDSEDQSVELRVWRAGRWLDLPSLRGVSAVAALDVDGDSLEELLFADGWHQNYGLFAEPRLSLMDCPAELTRCTLRHLDTLTPQSRIEKIRAVDAGGKLVVLVHGGQFVDAFYPREQWRRVRVHTRENKYALPMLDFAVLDSDKEGVYIAVLDGQAPLVKKVDVSAWTGMRQAKRAA
jgi:hypothetical protein